MKEQIKRRMSGLFKATVIDPGLPVPRPGRVFRPTLFRLGSLFSVKSAVWAVVRKTRLDCGTCGTGSMTPDVKSVLLGVFRFSSKGTRRLFSAAGKRRFCESPINSQFAVKKVFCESYCKNVRRSCGLAAKPQQRQRTASKLSKVTCMSVPTS